MGTTAKYYRKIDAFTFEPFATSKREMKERIEWHKSLFNDLGWCPDCNAVVAIETTLEKTGYVHFCKFCGRGFATV